MDLRPERLESRVTRLDALLVAAAPGLPGNARAAIERWRADAAALRFHLRRSVAGDQTGNAPPVLVLLGGTGTGKSTLTNRLLGANLSAASFRRTFTAGPVALARSPEALPAGWLGLEAVVATAEQLPAKGQPGALVVVPVQGDLTDKLTLIDTPDLDGDQPAHHAQADRAFRWAEAVLFLVTPEKYQMTELLPYYRLARRYGVPALYVMNKCEEQAVLDDYRGLLAREGSQEGSGFGVQDSDLRGERAEVRGQRAEVRGQEADGDGDAARVFAVARDDSTYQPPAGQDLAALRESLLAIPSTRRTGATEGLRVRGRDLMGRFADQVLAPMREDRREADRLIASLRAMETPTVGVDVNPLTQQLQRRLQQRSILYLMGPGRVLDRVRQAPGLIARLPRVAWDYLSRGELSAASLNAATNGREREVPEFRSILADQFAVLQSRIDDALRSTPAGERWLGEDSASASGGAGGAGGYASAKLPTDAAAKIADEELADLKQWLEQRWNATPRDTKAIQTLLKHLPGGNKLVQWTEAAPYLLTIALVTHGAVFGHIDLVVLGGYGLATWISERLSNEVTARTRAANAKIADRFAALGHDQIERVCAWLDKQAPPPKTIERLERAADEANEVVQG